MIYRFIITPENPNHVLFFKNFFTKLYNQTEEQTSYDYSLFVTEEILHITIPLVSLTWYFHIVFFIVMNLQ